MSINTITIDDGALRLNEIQQMFCNKFPHLSLEFFEIPHKEGEASDIKRKFDSNLKLDDIRKEGSFGKISIHGNLKTSSLESLFESEFGIHVQVLRKSGNVWLQTTATDSRTLSEQEEEGKEASEK
jgi:hypothetical protein